MAKPWARYEIDFIHHPKFLALSQGAILLWIEGKNYCDKYHTDGMIPRAALRTFRFCNRARVGELKQVIEGYMGPLWEEHAVGFKIRDYLIYNDCREQVLQRLEDAKAIAELRQAGNAKRQQAHRDKRKSEVETLRTELEALRNAVINAEKRVTLPGPTETETETPTEKKPLRGGGKRPIYTSDRFVVFEWQLDELGRMLGPHFEDFGLDTFFDALTQQSRTRGLVIPADREKRWQWLQEQVLTEARRRGLPVAGEQAAVARVNGCFHNPPCANASQHTKLHLAETA